MPFLKNVELSFSYKCVISIVNIMHLSQNFKYIMVTDVRAVIYHVECAHALLSIAGNYDHGHLVSVFVVTTTLSHRGYKNKRMDQIPFPSVRRNTRGLIYHNGFNVCRSQFRIITV